MVAYCFVEGSSLLAIRRKAHPYQHRLALVGGFVNKDEDATMPVSERSKKKLGSICQWIRWSSSWQFPPGRDPRGWVITIAHLVYLPAEAVDLAHAGDDAKGKSFFSMSISKVPVFARWRTLSCFWFCLDHYQIIQESIKRIQGRLDWNPTFLYLLEGALHRLWSNLNWSIWSILDVPSLAITSS